MNSHVSNLNKYKTEENNVASDDTLEEAPTITEELAKEPTVKKGQRIVSDRIKNTKKKANKSLKLTQNNSNITHFAALALIGEEVFGKVRQAKKKRYGIPDLSPSSSNEDRNLPGLKELPTKSHTFYESIEDKKGKPVDPSTHNQHLFEGGRGRILAEKRIITHESSTQTMVRQEKVKVMRIREECEVIKYKRINPVAVIDTIAMDKNLKLHEKS